MSLLNNKELPRCPDCNGEPTITKEINNTYSIMCNKCNRGQWGFTFEAAVKHWNAFADRKLKDKTATEIIEEVRETMCNDYCRYMHEGKSSLTEEEKAYYEEYGCIPQCDDCPLNRL